MTTWYRSSTTSTLSGANSGIFPQGIIDELYNFFVACQAETPFLWQVASYSNVSPQHLMLKRKDGSPGRLLFYGNSSVSASAASALLPMFATTLHLLVAYDPVTTSDTPNNWTTSNPLSSTSSLGRACLNLLANSIQTRRYRAFCSDDGQLFLHVINPNAGSLLFLQVGAIFKAASGESTVYEGICTTAGVTVSNNHTALGYFLEPARSLLNFDGIGTGEHCKYFFGNPDLSAAGLSGSTRYSFCSARINNTWYQLNRFTSGRWDSNNTFTDSQNKHHFLPLIWVVTPDSGAVLPSVLKSKNIGIGPCRTRDFVLVDNQLATRGYYLGYHGTQGSDSTAMTLLNDDM